MDENGKISASGKAKSKFDKELRKAIRSNKITVTLNITEKNDTEDETGRHYMIVGQYEGSRIENGIIQASQSINLNHAEIWNRAGGSSIGLSVKHEIVEAFIGGKKFPGVGYTDANYNTAHNIVRDLEGRQFIPQHVEVRTPTQTQFYLIGNNGENLLLYTVTK